MAGKDTKEEFLFEGGKVFFGGYFQRGGVYWKDVANLGDAWTVYKEAWTKARIKPYALGNVDVDVVFMQHLRTNAEFTGNL